MPILKFNAAATVVKVPRQGVVTSQHTHPKLRSACRVQQAQKDIKASNRSTLDIDLGRGGVCGRAAGTAPAGEVHRVSAIGLAVDIRHPHFVHVATWLLHDEHVAQVNQLINLQVQTLVARACTAPRRMFN